MRESKIARARDRFSDAKNRNTRRQQVFENSTRRQSFLFERVEMKTATLQNERIIFEIERVVRRDHSTSSRELRPLERRERNLRRARTVIADRARDDRERSDRGRDDRERVEQIDEAEQIDEGRQINKTEQINEIGQINEAEQVA
jgi:hypothetical protein